MQQNPLSKKASLLSSIVIIIMPAQSKHEEMTSSDADVFKVHEDSIYYVNL